MSTSDQRRFLSWPIVDSSDKARGAMTTKTKMICLLIAGAFSLTFAVASRSAKHLLERRLDEEALSRMDGEGGSVATPLHEL